MYNENDNKANIKDPYINEYGEIIRDGVQESNMPDENTPNIESFKETMSKFNEAKPQEPIPVKETELEKMAREKRRFTILQRQRAIDDAQRRRTRAGIMAGLCILGASAAIYFSGQDINQAIQHELSAIYSWESLVQYLKDLGPLTTLLSAGAGGFISKYFKQTRKLRDAQHEFEDFNASLEGIVAQELGGNENAKSR